MNITITREDADSVCIALRDFLVHLNEGQKNINEQLEKDKAKAVATGDKVRGLVASIVADKLSDEIKRKKERALKCLDIMTFGSDKEQQERVELAISTEKLYGKIEELIALSKLTKELRA